jgi:glyoxylase-like metal-dependent hydrolase (beta-lactamase superfamily II)
MNPTVTAFVHEPTASLTYVVREPDGSHCAVVDPVLDYDNHASRTDTASIDPVLAFIRAERLAVDWILETHAHADRLSAAQDVKAQCDGRVAIGEHIVEVQESWKRILNLGGEFRADGSEFDPCSKQASVFGSGCSKRPSSTPRATPRAM